LTAAAWSHGTRAFRAGGNIVRRGFAPCSAASASVAGSRRHRVIASGRFRTVACLDAVLQRRSWSEATP